MKTLLMCACALGAAMLSPVAASAANCAPPKKIASLPIRDEGAAGFSVPISVNGKATQVHLWLGAHTALPAALFDPTAVKSEQRAVGGFPPVTVFTTKVQSFAIGTWSAGDIDIDVIPAEANEPFGLLGTDTLANFDMELDFPDGVINLYQHETCPGGGAGWMPQAAISFTLPELHKLSFPMQLDGKQVTTTVDLNTVQNRAAFNTASALFGLTPSDPKITSMPAVDQSRTVASFSRSPAGALRAYTFGSLSSGGFAMENPTAELWGHPDSPICDGKHARDGFVCYGFGDFSLGLSALRATRVYIAFSEHMLYLTNAK